MCVPRGRAEAWRASTVHAARAPPTDAVGAYAYLVASLRDDGWLWWAPQAGRLYGGLDDATPLPPRGDAQAAIDGVVGSCLGFDCGCGDDGRAMERLVEADEATATTAGAPLISGSGSGFYRYGDGRA